jgi:hypothetical protein
MISQSNTGLAGSIPSSMPCHDVRPRPWQQQQYQVLPSNFTMMRRECPQDTKWQRIHGQITSGALGSPWQITDGLIHHTNRIFVPATSSLLPFIIQLVHTASHDGIQKTLHRLRANFFVPNDKALVRDWVRSCTVCQQNKTVTLHPAVLLQPLEVPSQVWADISMDFIEGLPKVHGKSVILTVVDRFSKYAQSSLLATLIQLHQLHEHSLRELSAFMGSPPQL